MIQIIKQIKLFCNLNNNYNIIYHINNNIFIITYYSTVRLNRFFLKYMMPPI